MKKAVFIITILLLLTLTAFAEGALVDYGRGFIYDTDLDITWYDTPPVARRNWYDQMTWAANLVVEVNGKSFTEWRLPTTPGTTMGFIPEGEMGHLYHNEFNIISGASLTVANKDPFIWLQADGYWTGTEYEGTPIANYPPDTMAWAFNFAQGSQIPQFKVGGVELFPLAVHDGNIGAAVPECGTMLLLGSGLLGLVGIRRRMIK